MLWIIFCYSPTPTPIPDLIFEPPDAYDHSLFWFICSRLDFECDPGPMPECSVDDLIGRSFLLPPGDNGE